MADSASASGAPTARLFLALRPDRAVQAVLAKHARAWRWPAGAARYAPADWHVTLHFLGAVARARLDELSAALDVPLEPFELRFGEPALWPHGLAVLLPMGMPLALQRLHHELGGRLRRLGLHTDVRPYHPHLTLARNAGKAVAPPPPAWGWQVRGYVLMESTGQADMRYRLLRHYGQIDTSADPGA